MYRIKFSPRAASTLYDCISFYENAKIGLGEEFRKQLLQKVNTFQIWPFQGRKYVLHNGQEIRITPFPSRIKPKFKHVIIFAIDDEQKEVIIQNIPHTSSNWKGELFRENP